MHVRSADFPPPLKTVTTLTRKTQTTFSGYHMLLIDLSLNGKNVSVLTDELQLIINLLTCLFNTYCLCKYLDKCVVIVTVSYTHLTLPTNREV